MNIDLETRLFARFINIKKFEYNYNVNYHYSIFFVFKKFILPIILKKHEYKFNNSIVKDKTKIKTLLKELLKKVEFEPYYDDFHNCFNFSFSIKSRKNITFKMDYSIYNHYKKIRVEISDKFYKSINDIYNTPAKYNKFKEHFTDLNKLIKKNMIIHYDIINYNSYEDDSDISNMYLEIGSKLYDLKIENILNENKKIYLNQNNYYDEDFKQNLKIYNSYFFKNSKPFKINIKHSILNNTIIPYSFNGDESFKDLSGIIIDLSKKLNISLDDLNESHLKLAEISLY